MILGVFGVLAVNCFQLANLFVTPFANPRLSKYAPMGFYDRDYQRGWDEQHEPGLHLNLPSTLTTKLIIVTCGVYLVQLATRPWLNDIGAPQGDWYRRPWLAYQLLSYGFLHSTDDLWHIALNMFALWLFGREVEARYGKREFLAFYLVAIVVAGLVWTLAEIPSHGAGR